MVQTVQNPKWFDVIFETSRPQQKRCRTPQNPKTTASLIKISSNPTASFGKNPPTNRWNLFQQKLCRLGLGLASLASVFLDWSFSSCRRLDELMDGWDPIRRTTQLPYLGCGFLVNQLDQQGCFFKHVYDMESRNPQLNLHLPRLLGRTQLEWWGVDFQGCPTRMKNSHNFSRWFSTPRSSILDDPVDVVFTWGMDRCDFTTSGFQDDPKLKFISSVEKGSNPTSTG